MRRVILSSVACLAVMYSSTLSHEGNDFRGKVFESEICILIFSTNFDFLYKFWFSLQILIFSTNFDFLYKFWFSLQNLIFFTNFDLLYKFWFSLQLLYETFHILRIIQRDVIISQYPEGPAIGHFDTGFSWFSWVYKRMLRWFPNFQVATTCFSCSPTDLKFLVFFIFVYM